MDLLCKDRRLWGQRIDVRGTHFDVPVGGHVLGVNELTAAVLLQSADWARAPMQQRTATAPPAVPPSTPTRLATHVEEVVEATPETASSSESTDEFPVAKPSSIFRRSRRAGEEK